MASELGIDEAPAKRAGLLHDLGKAIDHEVEGPHAVIGADLARRYGERPEIVHAIEAHHADVDPDSVLDVLVQAADAISAARPGARRESAENYIKRLEKLEEISNAHEGVERTYAMPGLALSTDVIVGFPGEQEEDFLQTLSLVREAAFSSAFTFIYSKRPGTPAAKIDDPTPHEVIQDRFDRLAAQVALQAHGDG